MLKFLNKCRLTKTLYCLTALLFICISPISHAALSPEDTLIINAIKTQTINIPHPYVMISVLNGNVTLSGNVENNELASDLIATIIAVPGTKNINIKSFLLANGRRISPEAITIGFTKGNLLRSGLYGKKVKHIYDLPVNFTAENGIVYIDGIVNNVYTLVTTVKTAQLVAQRFNGRVRIISRLTIRKVTVRMP